jgi:Ca2+-binding RTX toxin-like protein
MTRSHAPVVLSVLAVLSWFTVGTLPATAAFCDAPVADITLTNGDDVLVAADSPGGDVIVGLAGDDDITPGVGADTVCAGSGKDTVTIDVPGDGVDTVYGGSGDDVIDGAGDGEFDSVFGDSGDDTLSEGGGIDGGSGTDACSATASPRVNCP